MKIVPIEVGQKNPSSHRPKNYIGFKSNKLDLDMKSIHLNGFKVKWIELDME